jgi:hypothetical protein
MYGTLDEDGMVAEISRDCNLGFLGFGIRTVILRHPLSRTLQWTSADLVCRSQGYGYAIDYLE